MSIPIVKVICLSILAIMGLFVVKSISNSQENILTVKNLLLMLCLIALPAMIYDINYNYIYTISVYVMMSIIYKYILKISFVKSIISCGILLVFIIILDFIASCILIIFLSADQVRDTWYLNILANLLFSVVLITLFNIKSVKKWFIDFVNRIELKKQTKMILFFALMIIAMSATIYTISIGYKINFSFLRKFFVFIILFVLVIILFTERDSYDKLSQEYDDLFENVKIFEDWIEKEQFIRHEYRNQLAVLRALTNQKKVKDKIDSINDEMINIDDNFVHALSGLPNGGIKGILYYKIAVARNKNVNIDIDIGCYVDEKIKKLSDAQMSTLTKLIGVYCDNAIEASENTKNKIVTIEIYCLDNILNIVVSNTFNTNEDITNRNEKGVSTKGTNRGKGLYFANKLLSKSNWIDQEQRIINNIYVQKLLIEIT